MFSKFKNRFLVSLQLSGRRWVCNVLGHYDMFLRGEDPTGIWAQQPNPLEAYGTQDRYHLVPTHCTQAIGGQVVLPKFYSFRSAVVITRHPAKVAFSRYRGRKKKDPNFQYTIEEYLEQIFADFYITYSNEVYRNLGQSNKLFLTYADLFAEQYLEEIPNWGKMARFVFGKVEPDLLHRAIDNNNAEKSAEGTVEKFIRTPPDKMDSFYEEELMIRDFLAPRLEEGLNPAVLSYFKENKLL